MWALAAALSVQLAPSPVYVAVVIGISALVVATYGLGGPLARAFPVLVGLAVAFGLVRVVLAAATSHGIGTVLFTTPAVTLPRLLGGFTVGGPVELEVVLQAGAEAFAIVGLVAAFGAFNAVVSHHELVQTVPRAFYELGLVVIVALAFVPATLESIHVTREADRARTGGRTVRRGRLLRQIVPVLERGLERAMALAESMDARGFGRELIGRAERGAAWCGLGALVLLGGSFVALVARSGGVAAVLGLAGAGLLVGAVVLASRASGRPRYRPRTMRRTDWAVASLSMVAPLALGLLGVADDSSLTWAADPLRWPAVHALAVLSLAALSAPLLLQPIPSRAGYGRRAPDRPDRVPSTAEVKAIGGRVGAS